MPHDGKLITALLVSDVAVIPEKAQGPVAESQHLIQPVTKIDRHPLVVTHFLGINILLANVPSVSAQYY